MNYTVLYNRLNSYENLRSNQDKELTEAIELKRTKKKENWILGISMVIIVCFPLSVVIRITFFDHSETILEIVETF